MPLAATASVRPAELIPDPGGDRLLWAAVGRVVRERRSNLLVDPDRPVPPELIERLLELACWAPNHKLTQPWRFCVASGAGRARLGATVAAALAAAGAAPPQVEKASGKYLRAQAVIVAGSAAHEDPVLHAENRDAVAAGVQNLLLGATALGLVSFWASCAPAAEAAVKRLAGFAPRDQLVALIYLGWPTGASPPGRRDAPAVTYLDG